MKARLYRIALDSIAEHGYEQTTLRAIAREAEVSPALLYRYFPNKAALVLQLYEELSGEFAARAGELPSGAWGPRFVAGVRLSLEVLGPHRRPLRALVPLLVGDPEQGLFAPQTVTARERVEGVFLEVARSASNAPKGEAREALGRVLYLLHLALVLWWLLDRSAEQRATSGLLALCERLLGPASLALKLAPARAFVIALDTLVREGLLGEEDAPTSG